MINRLSLRSRFALVFTTLALLSLVGYGNVVSRLRASRADANVINLAGRQRTLIQRMAKEAAEMIRLDFHDPKAADELQAAADEFDRTLAGLLEGDAALSPPALTDPDERAAAERVRAQWRPFRSAVEVLISRDSGAEPASQMEAARFILTAEDALLAEADGLVALLQLHAERRMSGLWQFSLLMGGLVMLVVIAGGVIVQRHVSLPLRRLARAAEAMAQGDPSAGSGQALGARGDLPYNLHDEVGQLTLAFNEMAESLDEAFAAMREANRVEQTRRREAEALREVTTALTSTLELDQVLEGILLHLEQVISYDSAGLFLLEEERFSLQRGSEQRPSTGSGQRLRAVAGQGFPNPGQVVGHEFPADNALFQEIHGTGRPLVLDDVQAESRFEGWGNGDYIRGWMGVPLIAEGEVIGYLTLNSQRVAAYGEAEAALAQAFANHAAVVIENARLFEQVRRSKQEWEASIDAIAEGVALLDNQFIIMRANWTLARLLDTTPQALVGQDVHEAICGCAACDCTLMATLRAGEATTLEMDGVEDLPRVQQGDRRDAARGRSFHVSFYPMIDQTSASSAELTASPSSPADGGQKREGNVLVMRDVTQERGLQTQLLQSEKMASIGQLAAGVAHEINNPMGFISSNLNTLAEYTADLTSLFDKFAQVATAVQAGQVEEARTLAAEARQYEREIDGDFIFQDMATAIDESREGAERVKRTVLDLRDFSRTDTEEPADADLNAAVESTLNIVWNELKYKATVNREYGDLPLVRCHSMRLQQVFMNLLINAAQAIPERGEITIRTYAQDGSVFVEISDTGVGIPAENLPRIFDPFFTTKEVGEGTGLGLSVAQGIVEQHGGRIEVESRVGEGSTFTVMLPVYGP